MKAFASLTAAILIVIGTGVGLIAASISGRTSGVPNSLANEISHRYSSLGISFVITGQQDRKDPSWYYYHLFAPGYLYSDYQPVYGFAKKVPGGWFDTGVGSALVGCSGVSAVDPKVLQYFHITCPTIGRTDPNGAVSS